MPASSEVSKPISRLGSLCLGSLDSTAAKVPGASLLAHPPALTCCVSLTVIESCIRYSCLASSDRIITADDAAGLHVTPRKCLGSGDPPGLQNRWSPLTGDGVFDSHALPPKSATTRLLMEQQALCHR